MSFQRMKRNNWCLRLHTCVDFYSPCLYFCRASQSRGPGLHVPLALANSLLLCVLQEPVPVPSVPHIQALLSRLKVREVKPTSLSLTRPPAAVPVISCGLFKFLFACTSVLRHFFGCYYILHKSDVSLRNTQIF